MTTYASKLLIKTTSEFFLTFQTPKTHKRVIFLVIEDFQSCTC